MILSELIGGPLSGLVAPISNEDGVIGSVDSFIKTIDESQPFIGISRHRLLTDGEGVTTLAAFHDCPLSCKYCINPHCKQKDGIWQYLTPKQLVERVKIDDIYFKSTGGGITLGGGEPLLYPDFIIKLHNLIKSEKWSLYLETSLNVPEKNITKILSCDIGYIIDIKDMNPVIYKKYTGLEHDRVIQNLNILSHHVDKEKVLIRVPLIDGFNTESDVEQSVSLLSEMGFRKFDRFSYVKNSKPMKEESGIKEGKAICNVLRSIRQTIADANEIQYTPAKCNHTGDCMGTCPMCDYELSEITSQLKEKSKNGITVNI